MSGRIIMALWKQKGEMIDKEPEPKQLPCEESSLLANEDVKMSEVYSAVLSVDVRLTLLKMNVCVEPCENVRSLLGCSFC
jgi:hypothetical protein